MSQRANHLAWSVLFSPTGDIRSLTEGYLFIAIKKKHVPPMPETYQSGLGILQKENLVYKITLYNSGPVKTFVGISQSKNFLMISHGSRICYVAFQLEQEAEICKMVIEYVSSGNQTEVDRLFTNPLGECDYFNSFSETEDMILEILRDPSFPDFLKEFEFLLAKYPTQTAELLSKLEADSLL